MPWHGGMADWWRKNRLSHGSKYPRVPPELAAPQPQTDYSSHVRQPVPGDTVYLTTWAGSGGTSVIGAVEPDPLGRISVVTPDGTTWYRWAPTPQAGHWNWPGSVTGL